MKAGGLSHLESLRIRETLSALTRSMNRCVAEEVGCLPPDFSCGAGEEPSRSSGSLDNFHLVVHGRLLLYFMDHQMIERIV